MGELSSAECSAIAAEWLREFAQALVNKDAGYASRLFIQDGWLRDVLVLSWDTRSIRGRLNIQNYLSARMETAAFDRSSFKLEDLTGLAPAFFKLADAYSGIEAAFTFNATSILGRGFFRLVLSNDDSERKWQALSVFVTPGDIRGHEENLYEYGIYDDHTKAWADVNSAQIKDVEKDPYVLIIGAGQTGLQVAARFRQMNIKAIVIEKNDNVGDNWRKRYPTLSLNTPRTHHTRVVLYAPYPRTWPIFTPRDKIASWLEHYAEAQDLVVWTSSTLVSQPSYNSGTRRWNVVVNRKGIPTPLSPAHIVLATGTLGDAYIPERALTSLASFEGVSLHASVYAGGVPFIGTRVLVVGAGTTAADICQDLVARGAAHVTMLQRRPTCIVSRGAADVEFTAWPEGTPYEVSDFRVAGAPLGLLGEIARSEGERNRRRLVNGKLWEALEKRGFRVVDGSNGGGRRELVYERLGGYWIDVGAAQLIIDGRIDVKSGVELARFAENGTTVEFTDGSTLDVDAVIFATGYQNIRPSMRKLLGADVIDKTDEVWGLDAEGELRGCYRPSGHPGLWYAAGDFYHSRYMSKQLALIIKSEELGLTMTYPNLASVPSQAVTPTNTEFPSRKSAM